MVKKKRAKTKITLRPVVFWFFALCLIICPSHLLAKSCEKNGTCKSRFQIQNDPYDIERESSRSHITIYFTASMIANRALSTEHFARTWGRSPTILERVLISSATLITLSMIKDLAYDSDGLSRSDILNNSIGIALEIPLEFAFF